MGTDFCSICCVHLFSGWWHSLCRLFGSLVARCGCIDECSITARFAFAKYFFFSLSSELRLAFFYVPLPSIKSNGEEKNGEEEAGANEREKKRLLLELEQLPYLHHRPHESTPHSYPQSTCHQFENFNLIKIQWTNDEDDDDEASALEIKLEREKHAFRNFWLLNWRHKNASSVKRAGGGTLSNADLQTPHIFIHFLFTSCIYFYFIFLSGILWHRRHRWNCADIFNCKCKAKAMNRKYAK